MALGRSAWWGSAQTAAGCAELEAPLKQSQGAGHPRTGCRGPEAARRWWFLGGLRQAHTQTKCVLAGSSEECSGSTVGRIPRMSISHLLM